MKFEDLPLEEQMKLRKAFDKDPGILKLNSIAILLRKNKKYIEALQVFQEIDRQWEYLKQSHCKDYDKVIEETVKLSDLHLSENILQPLLENIITLFMCCDIIETAYFNANEVIKKANKNYSVNNFQDLVDLIGNVKRKLKHLQEQTGYMDDLVWGDSCDKYYEMIRSKARSILKKRNDVKRWGQNLKKYIDGTLDQK